jgi:hypothetical protein
VRGPGVAAKVAPIVTDQACSADSRRFAAEVLGRLGGAGSARPLQKALADPDLAVVGAAAQALGNVPDPETPKRYEACVLDLHKRMVGRMTGGRIDFIDYRAHLAAVVQLVDGATALADHACTGAVVQAAQRFLLPRCDVDYTDRTGENPAALRQRLATAVLAGCRAHPGPGVQEVLAALAERDDLGVAAAARELLDQGR